MTYAGAPWCGVAVTVASQAIAVAALVATVRAEAAAAVLAGLVTWLVAPIVPIADAEAIAKRADPAHQLRAGASVDAAMRQRSQGW